MTGSKIKFDAAMPVEKPRITARIAGRPVYLVLRPFAVGYVFATCAFDTLYFSTQSSEQRRFTVAEFGPMSEWLLGAGLIMTVLAGIAALADFCGERRFGKISDLGFFAVGNLLVVILQLYNSYLRYTDGSDVIMPMGFALSISAVVVVLCTPTQSWDRLYK